MTGLRWSFATLAFTVRLAIGFASGWSPAAPVRLDDTSSGACGTPVAMYRRSTISRRVGCASAANASLAISLTILLGYIGSADRSNKGEANAGAQSWDTRGVAGRAG